MLVGTGQLSLRQRIAKVCHGRNELALSWGYLDLASMLRVTGPDIHLRRTDPKRCTPWSTVGLARRDNTPTFMRLRRVAWWRKPLPDWAGSLLVVHAEGRAFYSKRPIGRLNVEVEGQDTSMETTSLAATKVELDRNANADARSINPAGLYEQDFPPE